MKLKHFCFVSVLTLLMTGGCSVRKPEIEKSEIDLNAVQRIWPGAKITMPAEVFPPSYRQKLVEGGGKDGFIKKGGLVRADDYMRTPEAVWRERIPVRSCIGYLGNITGHGLIAQNLDFNATCPACLRPLRFDGVDIYGGTVTAACCGAVFYEDPARYPANAPGKPDKVMRIPHLDGKVVEYSYFEFSDRFAKESTFGKDPLWQPWSPADGSRRHEIFLPDGYIRGKRLYVMINNVIPDLGWAYFYSGEDKYAQLLAAMFDRLADVYPGWPLWMPYSHHWGFALNRAGNGVLTREEFKTAKRPMRWDTQFWNTYERSLRMGQTKLGAYLPNYDMSDVVTPLVEAYAAIRGSKALKEYSRQKYGDPEKLDQHVMQNLFGEMVKLHKCYDPWVGNYTPAWFGGGILLSLLTQDRYFFDVANELMERNLYDECYSDNAPTQGSISYWSMVLNRLQGSFQLREAFYDPEVKKHHPRLTCSANALYEQMSSWRWILPAFGDAWNDLYPTGIKRAAKKSEDFASFHLPDYGCSVMRWGKAEGRRQEVCMIYQRVAGHNHSDALNIEYFVDGLPVLWDMGYGNGTADTDIRRHPELKEIVDADWPRPVFDTTFYYQDGKGTIPRAHWWSAEWNHRTPAHCTVMVDEQEPTGKQEKIWGCCRAGIPITVFSEPGGHGGKRLLEVLDVEERGAFNRNSFVHQYRRTLVTVETPSGGGYSVDIFRVAGGKMHEFYYHAISEKSTTSLPEGESKPGTLAHYRAGTQARPEMKETENLKSYQTPFWSEGYRHINSLRRLESEPGKWRLEWEYDPNLYAPRTAEGRKQVEELFKDQKPVSLAIHGIRQPGTEKQAFLWRARGLLTGHLVETLKDGTKLSGEIGTLGFVGGLDMLILERRADKDLKSVFVHVLEGRRSEAIAEVQEAGNIPCEALPDGAVALEIKLIDGYTDYLFCLADPAEIKAGKLAFKGRYGLVRTDKAGQVVQAAMIRGAELKYQDWVLKSQAEYSGTIWRLEGDLTGDRTHPAIMMQTGQGLPEGSVLAGYPVYLVAPDGWTDVFFIDSIIASGKGMYRVALQGHPTFIIDFLTVGKADEKDPYTFFPMETDLTKASFFTSMYGYNTVLVSLKDGKRYPVDVVHAEPHPLQCVMLRDKPFKQCGLKLGDKAFVIRYQQGNRVVIPVKAEYSK